MKTQNIRRITLWRPAAVFAVIMAMAFVYGCGNSGSDASNDGGGGGNLIDITAAAGTWDGTVTDDLDNTYNLFGLVSIEDEEFRFIINTDIDDPCNETQFVGTFSPDEMVGNEGLGNITVFADPGCDIFNFEPPTGTFELIVNEEIGENILDVTYSMDDGSEGSFSLAYSNIAKNPITTADLAGDWTSGFGTDITFEIDGTFSGTDLNLECDIEQGSVSISDPDLSIFIVQMTASNCTNDADEGIYSGLGLLDFGDTPEGDLLEIYTSSDTTSAYYQVYYRPI